MARPKKAKHRREPDSAAATLDELESLGDKVATWMSDNPGLILTAGAVILAVGALWGFVRSSEQDAKIDASVALAQVQAGYRTAMGGAADEIEVQEPANPETGKTVREEYVELFEQVAEAHAGTGAGIVALLEAGLLQQQLEREDDALATWQSAAGVADRGSALTALLELHIAGVQEQQSRWIQAAESFERAAAVESFPLRYSALGDAARCYAEAGDVDRALAAFERVESEAPDVYLPEHLSTRLRELRAARHLN